MCIYEICFSAVALHVSSPRRSFDREPKEELHIQLKKLFDEEEAVRGHTTFLRMLERVAP
jgi:hypothetical protein